MADPPAVASTAQASSASEDTTDARERALGITEILEAILINTDMKTLLLSQRVSRDWQEVITKSPSLQKKLFMQPATAEEAIELGITHGDRNTFLEDDTFAALNPLLIDIEDHGWWVPATYSLRFRGDQSWERMLLAQPPTLRNVDDWEPFDPWDEAWLLRHHVDKSLKRQKVSDFEPVEKRWTKTTEVVLIIRDVRGLISHAKLMKMKDSPPKVIETFPGTDIYFWEDYDEDARIACED